jgi:hypothetical protein
VSGELAKESYVAYDALKIFETLIDGLYFEAFPMINASAMSVLRAHVNEIRPGSPTTAWIPHDRLRRKTRLSTSTIKNAIKLLESAGLMKFADRHEARGIKVYLITLPGMTFTHADAKPKSKPPRGVTAVTKSTTAEWEDDFDE